MTTQTQATQQPNDWLKTSLNKAIRTVAAGGAVALMAAAAHASAAVTGSANAAPLSTSALQMSLGFCILALALHRRKAVLSDQSAEPTA